jgi:hypothetical protein
MKRRIVFGVYAILIISTLLICMPLSASAQVDVQRARIDLLGLIHPSDTRGAMIQLTDLGSNPAWPGTRQFFLSQAILGNEGLAIALTAFSLNKEIFVRITGSAEKLSLITIIYVYP